MLCKNIGRTVRAKGRRAGWYQVMLVGLWFAGELGGGIVGTVVTAMIWGRAEFGLLVYLFALGGAALGAWGAFMIAKSVGAEAERRGFAVLPTPVSPMEERIG